MDRALKSRWRGSWLGRLWRSYARIGDQTLAPQHARGTLVMAGFAPVGALSVWGYALFYIFLDPANLWPAIILNSVAGGFFLATPLAIARDLTRGALFLLFWGSIYFTGLTFLFGAVAGTHLGQYSGAVLLLLILGTGRLVLLGLVLSVAVAIGLVLPVLFPEPSMGGLSPELIQTLYESTVLNLIALTAIALLFAMQQLEQAEEEVAKEHARSEALLANLLPSSIAARLKARSGAVIADEVPQMTVLFADIVDFTPRTNGMAAEDLVQFLNHVFSRFDQLTEDHGLEKIKTIGDAYMVAAGLPDPRPDHAAAAAKLALAMLAEAQNFGAGPGDSLRIRIGLHTGPAVAGVIGTKKLFYDIWGDTVNMAAHLESHGQADRIQITQAAYDALSPSFHCTPRGTVDIKGKGPMQTWWLTGMRSS